MKKSNLLLSLILSFLFIGCAALKNKSSTELNLIQATIDLVKVIDDKVQINLIPPVIDEDEIIFFYSSNCSWNL